ncbi:MAG TPA: DUF3147 family protein [Bryobacteraceae bacterium]|jgi:hypothetical protein|nr:DUF3147 family protein [Bryobacteraceae bacterium]
MWLESAYRFVVGGLAVSLFALLGTAVKPASFAGLFSAAPSVALATLGLTIAKEGGRYASIECKSMIAGAAALCLYSLATNVMLMRCRFSALAATSMSMAVWFACAFGIWMGFLR